jgi:rhomboid protease GluP
MPCPRCRQLISKNTPKCIYCGLQRLAFYANFPFLNSLLRREFRFSTVILLVCSSLYIAALALDISRALGSGKLVGLILSPSDATLFNLGMGGSLAISAGHWWSPLTATYLHGSLLHIIFNMMALRSLGPLVEELYGYSRFLIIYTLAGLAGSLLSTLMGTYAFVGASGAIFGLGGALLYYGWRRGGIFGKSIFRNMLFFAIVNLSMGFTIARIDNWGHVGGLVGGFLVGLLVSYEERSRESLYHHIFALALLVGVVLCFIMVFANFLTGNIY